MIFGPGDLVERLRKYTVACRCEGCLMKIEAADEIGRLRRQLDLSQGIGLREVEMPESDEEAE